MEISPGTRASDAERERVIAALGRHMAEGRIDAVEYDERAARVYETTMREDLTVVLSDLPALPESSSNATKAREARPRVPIWQRIEGGAWLSVGVIVLVIWGAISLAAGEFTYPWPIWVIGPWGAVLVLRAVTGVEGKCGQRRMIR